VTSIFYHFGISDLKLFYKKMCFNKENALLFSKIDYIYSTGIIFKRFKLIYNFDKCLQIAVLTYPIIYDYINSKIQLGLLDPVL